MPVYDCAYPLSVIIDLAGGRLTLLESYYDYVFSRYYLRCDELLSRNILICLLSFYSFLRISREVLGVVAYI